MRPRAEGDGAPGAGPADLARREHRLWIATALALFAAAVVTLFAEVWLHDPRVVIPTTRVASGSPVVGGDLLGGTEQFDHLLRLDPDLRDLGHRVEAADSSFVVWAVARNARAWLREPARIFEAEPCAPARNALALGHPLLSMGLLGVPAWIATGDPVVTYNFVLVVAALLAAIAMYWLVAEWTGVPAAGVAAALLYAFHASKVGFVTYPFKTDTAWMILALLFARRFFARGRLRDGLAAALFCDLQIGLSFYPFLQSVVLAVPLLFWLLWHYGLRALRPVPVLASGAVVALGAWFVFSPYLALRQEHDLLQATRQLYAAWSGFLPGRYVGWLCFLLAVGGLLAPRRLALRESVGDPRLALLAGCVLIALLSTGGNVRAQLAAEKAGESLPIALPNLYALLGHVLPGLDSIRGVVYLAPGLHPALCILAGFGGAALLRAVPGRFATPAGVALVAVAYVGALHPSWLGAGGEVRYAPFRMRPSDETLAFYDALAERGSEGPLFEVPISLGSVGYALNEAGRQVMLSAYHHRRTSGCYNSFGAPQAERLALLSGRLPAKSAVHAIRELGFTTIVVHRTPGKLGRFAYWRDIDRAARRRDHPLRRLHADTARAAYAIASPAKPGAQRAEGERSQILKRDPGMQRNEAERSPIRPAKRGAQRAEGFEKLFAATERRVKLPSDAATRVHPD